MIKYERNIGTAVTALITPFSLMFQLLVFGLGISDPKHALDLPAGLGGATIALVFLLTLLGGLRLAIRTAGWTLAVHLVIYAGLLNSVRDSVPEYSELAVGLLVLGIAIAVVLIWTRTPPTKKKPV